MNILFLDQFSDLGGAQRCLIDLFPAIRDRGWKFHVAAPGAGDLKNYTDNYHEISCGPYESGGKTARDLLNFTRELPTLAQKIAQLAAEYRADVVYINGPRLLPAGSLAIGSRIPVIFHCHWDVHHRYATALAGFSLAAMNATVIGCCRYVVDPLRVYAAPNRIAVVYNGVVAGQRSSGSGRRIGIIGRIGCEKGQLEFVQAARLLPPGATFVICGAPLFSNPAAFAYSEQVRQVAAGLPVEFLGWRDDVPAVLADLDLLIVPSAPGEATPRVILEAFAAGVPVIATRSGGIPEIITDRETGYLIPSADPGILASKIREAVADDAARARIACNALHAWRQRHTLADYQNRILTILDRVGASART